MKDHKLEYQASHIPAGNALNSLLIRPLWQIMIIVAVLVNLWELFTARLLDDFVVALPHIF